MARTNLLNTRTANYLDLLGNGRIYRVPPYQRDYSWEEEQWEDLWNDILELRGHPGERHYMGALVVEGRSDREFLIIDGQQRLATFSVPLLTREDCPSQIAFCGSASSTSGGASTKSRSFGHKVRSWLSFFPRPLPDSSPSFSLRSMTN